MKPFLKNVAEDLYEKYGNRLADILIVFPNKRAGLFFNEYLKGMSDKPIWSPSYMTIDELFQENSSYVEGDPILLVSKLYREYCKHTKSKESLDKFYYWGELLIKDFDEIDKNMVDVRRLFGNLKDLHLIGSTVDALDEEQKEAIRSFFSNFQQKEDSEIKRRFLAVWEVLLPIYDDFRKTLRNEGIAYNGMLCRDVIENKEELNFPYEQYVFVGFNALNRVEDAMFELLTARGKALFYWDYDETYVDDKHHEAGFFMRHNLKKYPNVLQNKSYNFLSGKKNITFVSASTDNIQTRYLSDWLCKNVKNREIETAVVLCDEGLLEETLHAIPPCVQDINVTMGFPISHTPIFSFMRRLIELQINGYDENRKCFRYAAVHGILKHPYTLQCSDNAAKIDDEITKKHDFFPTLEMLYADEFLTKIFTYSVDNVSWISNVCDIIYNIAFIVTTGDKNDDVYDELFHESIFKVYTQTQRMISLLETGELQLELSTFSSLFMRVIGSMKLPFHGEPVVGLQIMGLLETRNLDFKNLILLSANEGNLPRNGGASSFIPYNLRRAFGLMLMEHRNSVYAYNFYRLIQRAENITILYNSSIDSTGQGERSRYMLQLLAERSNEIKNIFLKTERHTTVCNINEVCKNSEILERLRYIFDRNRNSNAIALSPSGINRYLDCPMKFFYYYVADLKIKQNVDSVIQVSDFGNIFHKSAELFYNHIVKDSGADILKSQLEPYIKKTALLYPFIDEAFKECFFLNEKENRIEYDGLQFINREVLHRFLVRLIKMDYGHTPFKYIGSEQDANFSMIAETADGEDIALVIGGRVDRMDLKGDTLEIIDYKTGGKQENIENIESLFAKTGRRNGYIFQAMLYSAALLSSDNAVKISPSLLYIHKQSKALRENFVINIKNTPVTDFSIYNDKFLSCLHDTVNEIFNINIPFYATKETDRCLHCDYRTLCGERQ